jgi:hypothetical protein
MPTPVTEGTLVIPEEQAIISVETTDDTKMLLRMLAYEGEVDVDTLCTRTGMMPETLRAAAIDGLFEVSAFDWGEGEPALIQLSVEGYYVARDMLRTEGQAKDVDEHDEPNYQVGISSTVNAENRQTWAAMLYEDGRVAMSLEVPRGDDAALIATIDGLKTTRIAVHSDSESPPMASYQVDRRLGVLIPALETLVE